MALDPLQAIRDIALAFPEASEKETWGHPTFRVRDKIFVSAGEADGGGTVLTMKAAPGEQESLLAEGHPYFLPKYVGSRGWIGIHVDAETDWRAVAELVIDSYREIAPKTLSASIGIRPGPRSRTASATCWSLGGLPSMSSPMMPPTATIAEAALLRGPGRSPMLADRVFGAISR